MEQPNGAKVRREKKLSNIKIAKEMFEKGYSYRQIMRKLGLKSSGSVWRYAKVLKIINKWGKHH